jgi:hypothetical protein
MINLTSIDGLVHSLISKALGDNIFTFIIYPNYKGNVLIEFKSNDSKFIVSKKEEGLRIYDNGNIYLIPDILSKDYVQEIDSIINQQADKLSGYYKVIYFEDQINKDIKANVYKFMKPDLN